MRHHQAPAGAFGAHRQQHGEHPPDRADLAGEGQFADELEPVQRLGRYLPADRQHPYRDGQIEASRVFGQIGRRQIDGEAPIGEVEAALQQRRAHPVGALTHGGLRQADDVEGRQAVAQVHLDPDLRGLQTDEGAGVNDGEGHRVALGRVGERFESAARDRRRRPTNGSSAWLIDRIDHQRGTHTAPAQARPPTPEDQPPSQSARSPPVPTPHRQTAGPCRTG